MAEFPEDVRNLLNDKGVGSPGGFEPPTFQLTAEKPTSSEPVATTGKGCLYIKMLADVDQQVSEALVVKSLVAKRARHLSHGIEP